MSFHRKYLNSPVIVVMMVAIIHISAINWIIYKQQKYVLKESFEKQLKAGISEDKLTRLSFTQEQISQVEWQDEKEFIWNGVFYDVLSKRNDGDYIVIECLRDDMERALEELAEKMAGQSNKDDEIPLISLKFIEWPIHTMDLINSFDSNPKLFVKNQLGIDSFEPNGCFRPPVLDVISCLFLR